MYYKINKSFTPWLNAEIRSSVAARNALQTRVKYDRYNVELQEQYRQKRNRVKFLLQNAERDYCKKELENCKGDISATCRLMRNIVSSKKINSDYGHTDDIVKAEELNEAFINVGKRTFEKTQNELDNVNGEREILHRDDIVYEQLSRSEPVDANTVILTIKHLKNINSIGSDGISLRHIRDSLPMIIHYIKTIINTSIVTGKFLSLWKHATVIPVYKNDDRNDVNNFRPVSLLPILSKILEKNCHATANRFSPEQ